MLVEHKLFFYVIFLVKVGIYPKLFRVCGRYDEKEHSHSDPLLEKWRPLTEGVFSDYQHHVKEKQYLFCFFPLSRKEEEAFNVMRKQTNKENQEKYKQQKNTVLWPYMLLWAHRDGFLRKMPSFGFSPNERVLKFLSHFKEVQFWSIQDSISSKMPLIWTLTCFIGCIYTYHIFVIFFTRAKFLENKIYTEKRQFFALNL